jgi:hypothetical protein
MPIEMKKGRPRKGAALLSQIRFCLVSVRELCLLFQGVNVSRLEGAAAQSMRGHR